MYISHAQKNCKNSGEELLSEGYVQHVGHGLAESSACHTWHCASAAIGELNQPLTITPAIAGDDNNVPESKSKKNVT